MGKRKVNKKVFLPPFLLSVFIILIGALIPEKLDASMSVVLDWVNHYCDWFYVLGMTLLLVFCLWVAFSKYGKIRLGGKDAKPEMSFWKWFCICLTSSMAVGITYWCIAEPLSYYVNPPAYAGYAGESIAAAENSLRYVFLHWTFVPFACFTVGGAVVGFLYWNCHKPFSISTGLYPIFGDKALGQARYWINALCIFGLVCGLGTTLGLAVDQISTGLRYSFGVNINDTLLAFMVCVGFALIAIAAASTGLHKGIAMVSQVNMYLFLFLMGFAFIFGGTHTILSNTITSIGKFFSFFVGETLNTEPFYNSGWVANQTVFYWGWWVAAGPMSGLFQVKLSKGRTLKEFIIVNTIAPSLFLIAWMGIFGSSALGMTVGGNASILTAINEWGSSVAFFAYAKQLPIPMIILVIAMITMCISIVTQTEAQILNSADMCVATDEEMAKSDNFAPVYLKVIWGLILSLMGFVLLFSGGLKAVQNISIIGGVLMLAILLLTCVGGIKAFRNYKLYDKTLGEGEDYE